MENIIHKSKHFRLVKWKHRKSDKVHYRLMLVDSWYTVDDYIGWKNMAEQVRDIVDPTRCRSGKAGTQWKYRNLEEATKVYTFLVVKFS